MTTGLRLEGKRLDPALPLPCDGGRRGSPEFADAFAFEEFNGCNARHRLHCSSPRRTWSRARPRPREDGACGTGDLQGARRRRHGAVYRSDASADQRKEDDWDRFEDLEYSVASSPASAT